MSLLLSTVLIAAMSGPLGDTTVTTDWLAANLGNTDVVVVEIGSAPVRHHAHIPGSLYLPIGAVATDGWPPHELPDVEQLRNVLGNAGIGDDGQIVLYSDNPLFATRAWFTLDYLGQSHRASILDGGLAKWQQEKRPVTLQRTNVAAKTFTAKADRSRLISHTEMRVTKFGPGTDMVLIDARPALDFYGYHRGPQVVRRGHIPDAECMPWQSNLNADGSFKSARELRERYVKLGATLNDRVVVYCRTGMEATMPYFVLRALGYDVVLYDGSFTEWSRDGNAPVVMTAMNR